MVARVAAVVGIADDALRIDNKGAWQHFYVAGRFALHMPLGCCAQRGFGHARIEQAGYAGPL